jgi:putative heme-binding domain-containing protein
VISIPGNEKEKFADLTKLVKSDRQRTTAVQALRTLPDSSWDPKELPSLVDNLVGYLSSIPAKLRTSGPATETVELVKSLSSRLPADLAKAVSDRLGNLDVRTIAIGTVVERMIYDKERIVLEAGKPVEFRFANTDNMPHNFVIVKPGSLEEVGLSSDAGAQEPDARERNFVPKSDKILLASKLIGPGESQAISFDVPTEPGMYPYVCTYPGHWRRMFGVLVVVSSIEQYNNDPEAYLASNPLEIRDELLKSIGRNTEWKIEDLTGELAGLKQGRSYEVGKSLFAAASCVGCHKLGGEGKEFGPDLSKLDDKKMTADSILKSLLMPSAEIEDKYRARIFQMDSDAIITGMVVEESDKEIKVMVDPLAKGDPTVLDKEEIVGQKVSSVSTMPQGLLNKLTKEEILDLMAYVLARGDKKHPAYQGHEHGDHNHGDH